MVLPALAVAAKLTVPVPHLAPGVLESIVGIALMVAAILVLLPVVQPFAVASTK